MSREHSRYRWFVVGVFFFFMLLHQTDKLMIGSLQVPLVSHLESVIGSGILSILARHKNRGFRGFAKTRSRNYFQRDSRYGESVTP